MAAIVSKTGRSYKRNGKTYGMLAVEASYPGMEIGDILRMLYARYGSMSAVARTVDVPLTTLAGWFQRLGIVTKDVR